MTIANNNPGNLRYDDRFQWQGLATPPKDAEGFCVFLTPEAGLRALAIDLRNQQLLHGLRTIGAIIPRYAPAADHNNITAYITDVWHRTGFAPTEVLDLTNAADLESLVRAVIWHENGACPYSDAQLADAVALALPTHAAPQTSIVQTAPSKPVVTLAGGAAAAGSSGLIMVIAQAELQRRHIAMEQNELLAIVALLAPVIHTAARIVQTISASIVRRYVGIDIQDGNGAAPFTRGERPS
jgi:hypothetical protein